MFICWWRYFCEVPRGHIIVKIIDEDSFFEQLIDRTDIFLKKDCFYWCHIEFDV